MILRRLVLSIVVLALTATACSAADTEVGRVGELSVTQSDVTAMRTTYGDELADAAAFREDLGRLLAQGAVAEALADEYALVVSPADTDELVAELTSQIDQSGMSLEDALGVPGASEVMLQNNAYVTLLRDRGIEAVVSDEAFLRAAFEDNAASLAEVCVRHILVATPEEAAAAAERLEGGEEFAAVATEISLDPGSPGGELGCSGATRYVPEFAQAALVAPIGELFGPVETQFGWHLLIVDDRSQPTLEDLLADPVAVLPQEVTAERWRVWLTAVFEGADIEVDPAIGSWDAASGVILPPGS